MLARHWLPRYVYMHTAVHDLSGEHGEHVNWPVLRHWSLEQRTRTRDAITSNNVSLFAFVQTVTSLRISQVLRYLLQFSRFLRFSSLC
jgi:hypothetical protein